MDVIFKSDERKCNKCGSILSEDEFFCKKCGKKYVNEIEEEDRKGKIKKIIIGIIATIFVIVIGINAINISKEEAKEEYISSAKIFTISAQKYAIESQETMDITLRYWSENIFEDKHGADIDAAILSAYVENTDKFTNCKDNKEKINAFYDNIKNLPSGLENDSDLISLRESAQNLYSAFNQLNDAALNPSGNYNSYTQERNNLISNYNEKNSDISSKLQ